MQNIGDSSSGLYFILKGAHLPEEACQVAANIYMRALLALFESDRDRVFTAYLARNMAILEHGWEPDPATAPATAVAAIRDWAQAEAAARRAVDQAGFPLGDALFVPRTR